ncbi:MAG TPA: PDZ domain-containing protein, partial [Planctomycetia bacterium]|nr:PDZ domain-containing protein [Planctomycetia bacterium]
NYQNRDERAEPADGVVVTKVSLNSTRRSGLSEQDVIVGINGNRIRNGADLMLHVGMASAGAPLKLEVYRNGRKIDVGLRLAKYPVEGQKIVTTPRPSWNGIRVDWLSILSRRAVSAFDRNEPPEQGVVADEIESGSVADGQGIAARSVIQAVDGKPVNDPDEFHRAVAANKGSVRLTVLVEGREPKDYVLPPPKPGAGASGKRNNEN